MKIFWTLIIYITFCGCVNKVHRVVGVIYVDEPLSDEVFYDKLTDKGVIQDYFYENTILKSKGLQAIDGNGRISNLRINGWIEYFENGLIKEKGNYEIGSYTECCFDGYCKMFYNYKLGNWEYFYLNGKLKAKGTYKKINLKIDTNCKGGDDAQFGILDDDWVFFDELGNKIDLTEDLRIEYETVIPRGTIEGQVFCPDYEKKELLSQKISRK